MQFVPSLSRVEVVSLTGSRCRISSTLILTARYVTSPRPSLCHAHNAIRVQEYLIRSMAHFWVTRRFGMFRVQLFPSCRFTADSLAVGGFFQKCCCILLAHAAQMVSDQGSLRGATLAPGCLCVNDSKESHVHSCPLVHLLETRLCEMGTIIVMAMLYQIS